MPSRRRRSGHSSHAGGSLSERLRIYKYSNRGWASLAMLVENPTDQNCLACWREAQNINDREGEALAGKLLHATAKERGSIIARAKEQDTPSDGVILRFAGDPPWETKQT
jgi:hypothetical protein